MSTTVDNDSGQIIKLGHLILFYSIIIKYLKTKKGEKGTKKKKKKKKRFTKQDGANTAIHLW